MVDELVNVPSNKTSSEQVPPSSFNASSVISGTPNQQSGPISVTDLVGRMMQKPNGPVLMHEPVGRTSSTSLTGIFTTPFTPRPEETASLSPGLATAFPAVSPTLSAQQFQQGLVQQEQDIQMKTSPLQRHQFTSPGYPQSPYGPPGFGHSSNNLSAPWVSPSSRSPSQQPRQLPQAALFGAIGEPRRSGSRTPMSGKSG